jgi:hypothetical protein
MSVLRDRGHILRAVIPAWLLAVALTTAAACARSDSLDGSSAIVDNAEMREIVDADQADRQPDLADLDWAALAGRDAARRLRVRALLEQNQLRSGEDFGRAALVFQHGETDSDILLAHVLAMTAVAEGHTHSRRLAALTLDRYLTRVGRAQVFGTQFSTTDINAPAAWTLEPYDDELIPDALRLINCVESRDATQRLLAGMQAGDLSDPAPVCPEPDR